MTDRTRVVFLANDLYSYQVKYFDIELYFIKCSFTLHISNPLCFILFQLWLTTERLPPRYLGPT